MRRSSDLRLAPEEIVRVDDLGTTTWKPQREWPRGEVLIWQVTARRDDGSSVRAPVPPAPEARFAVLPGAELEQVDRRLQQIDDLVDISAIERAVARARVLAEAGLMVVSGIAIGLLTNLIQQLIDEVMAERKPKYTVQEVPQSDGTKLLVVVVEKAI